MLRDEEMGVAFFEAGLAEQVECGCVYNAKTRNKLHRNERNFRFQMHWTLSTRYCTIDKLFDLESFDTLDCQEVGFRNLIETVTASSCWWG
jgi:hypothetical protein